MNNNIDLPEMLFLEDFGGDIDRYLNVVYDVFIKDFVNNKTYFRSKEIRITWEPTENGKAYTFLHMTTKGKEEQNRGIDFRRCERITWAKPTVDNCEEWNLKIWPQERNKKNRICIWLERSYEPDYCIILEIRKNYMNLVTTFVALESHEKRKKQQEYEAWIKKQKPPL